MGESIVPIGFPQYVHVPISIQKITSMFVHVCTSFSISPNVVRCVTQGLCVKWHRLIRCVPTLPHLLHATCSIYECGVLEAHRHLISYTPSPRWRVIHQFPEPFE